MPRITRVSPLAVVISAILASSVTLAQDADRCLNNAGQFAVPPGSTYSDSRGVWLCAPGHPESTVGGWVLSEETPAATPEPSAPPAPPGSPPVLGPAEPASTGFPLVWIVASGGLLAGLVAALSVRRLIQRERLTGFIVIEEEDSHG